MEFICYPRCTTCKRAKTWLEEKGCEFKVRDIKENPPSYEEIKLFYEKSGLDIKKFFNTSGLSYKSLGLKDKLSNLSIEDKLKLLSSDGMLIKRPILLINNNVLVGFKADAWAEAINSL
ncbi:MAG: arsenate reductase family protein [Clostridiales bacterium]|nr:arsenate reductase family protein [Clostridiales bacterium]